MIRKFKVSNFKGFKDELVFDLSRARDYNFNAKFVENGIVKKGLIYGKNGTGKSNLGFALYDLTFHLTDKQKNFNYYQNYSNLNNKDKIVRFTYEFQFDNEIYTYSYCKESPLVLISEILKKDNEVLIDFDYRDGGKRVVNIEEAMNLKLDLIDGKLSILKYIYSNTPTNDNIVSKIVKFAEGMLWFRCLDDNNNFIGLLNGGSSMDDIIINNNKLTDFEDFLRRNDLDYRLESRNFNGQNLIVAKYDNGEALFSSVASSGTKALWLYFCWTVFFGKVSFLFLDEFDAFYHYETSELVIKAIFNDFNIQAFVTSHNTYLMKNSIIRPDCCFILTHGKIAALADCTQKEIREAHNLEKMYINGTFTEN